MPSFDIVSEVDMHHLTNAVDQASRIVANRFDFKGVDAGFVREERIVSIFAEAEFQVSQMQDMLRGALVKCDIDPGSMAPEEMIITGKQVKQKITMRHGLETDRSKAIIKEIKASKIKVQSQIQGEQVRVTGKKRDDLQKIIGLLRDKDFGLPLQFNNFRD